MAEISRPNHVALVGAGMVGLATAWFLQERGVRVTIVDRVGVAAGSSWGNAGWLAPALTLPLPEPAVLRYGIRAVVSPSSPVYVPLTTNLPLLRFLVGFARHCTPGKWRSAMGVFAQVNRLGLDAFAELEAGGVAERTTLAEPFLTGFVSERDRNGLLEEFRMVTAAGGEVDHGLLTGDELRAIEPTLSDKVIAGVSMSGQRFINPPIFVNSLADAVRSRGAEIITGFDASELHDTATGIEIVSRVGETVAADQAVLANGTWLGMLARPYGVRRLVQAGRGYSFSIRPDVVPTHPIYFPAQRVACTPLGDRLRVGGMMEFRPADAPMDPRRIRTIVEAARPMFTGVDWDAREDEWVGSRPCTTDGLPLIGATRSPRVYVAGGHGMWGIALGPLTGKLLADSMTGHGTDGLMRHFDPLR
ncbi:MAG: NAD(P)/FAD-dependent oxidoreductase [Lacisediminihabitans sp.]